MKKLLIIIALTACSANSAEVANLTLSTKIQCVEGHITRSPAAKAKFRRYYPCPKTGLRTGACTGYVVDHMQALCMGGADDMKNMAWQTVYQGKLKDAWELLPGWEQKLADCKVSGKCFVK